jgi:hypothetical protein
MLRAVLREPGLIEDPPTMVLGSLRLHGDPAFVRSTEELLRVHVELHHRRGPEPRRRVHLVRGEGRDVSG